MQIGQRKEREEGVEPATDRWRRLCLGDVHSVQVCNGARSSKMRGLLKGRRESHREKGGEGKRRLRWVGRRYFRSLKKPEVVRGDDAGEKKGPGPHMDLR
jgi:hypothetical protein